MASLPTVPVLASQPGIRATILHIALFNLMFVVALLLLKGSPVGISNDHGRTCVFRNDWQHMNIVELEVAVEWLFVTPKYHQIHHSDNPNHYVSNLGSLFTIWDRMF